MHYAITYSIVQITSIVNVGCAAYGQLLKAKNRSDESTEETDKKTFEPIRPTRLLLLALSDGLTDTQAMEYEHLQQLRVDTPPGTKVGCIRSMVWVLWKLAVCCWQIIASVLFVQCHEFRKRPFK